MSATAVNKFSKKERMNKYEEKKRNIMKQRKKLK